MCCVSLRFAWRQLALHSTWVKTSVNHRRCIDQLKLYGHSCADAQGRCGGRRPEHRRSERCALSAGAWRPVRHDRYPRAQHPNPHCLRQEARATSVAVRMLDTPWPVLHTYVVLCILASKYYTRHAPAATVHKTPGLPRAQGKPSTQSRTLATISSALWHYGFTSRTFWVALKPCTLAEAPVALALASMTPPSTRGTPSACIGSCRQVCIHRVTAPTSSWLAGGRARRYTRHSDHAPRVPQLLTPPSFT
jgi:hypothetical protein